MLQRTPRFAACFPSASTRIIASNVNRISRITQRGERVFLSTVRRTATVTPSPIAERSIVTSVSVCLSVCLSRSLPNLLCMLHIDVARSSFGGVVTRYVLQVLWMTSYLRKQEVARRRRPAEAQCTRSLGLGYKLCAVIPAAGQRTHGTTFRALKVTSQVATAGRSLRSMTALFLRSSAAGNEIAFLPSGGFQNRNQNKFNKQVS